MNRISVLRLTKCRIAWRTFSSNEQKTISDEAIYEAARKHIVYSENDGYSVKSPYILLEIPEMTIDQHVWNSLSKWPNHIAIECSLSGRKYTYSSLRDRSAALALRLRKHLNICKNDIVAIFLPNVPGDWQNYFF